MGKNEMDKQVETIADRVRLLLTVLIEVEADATAGLSQAPEALQEAERVLPASLKPLWACYREGRLPERNPANEESFRTLWPYFRAVGTPAQAARFASLALALEEGEAVFQCTAREAIEDENWPMAMALLMQVPQNLADGPFWEDIGVTLYHLGEFDGAREALMRAEQAGQHSGRLRAYQKWAAESGQRTKGAVS